MSEEHKKEENYNHEQKAEESGFIMMAALFTWSVIVSIVAIAFSAKRKNK